MIVAKDAILAQVLAGLGSPSFLSLLGNHLFFNIREVSERGVNGGARSNANSVSVMEFV